MSRGFSLIELLVVLATLSALGTVAAPNLSSWHSRHIVAREASRVQMAVERAYVLSLARETVVAISLAPGGVTATTSDSTPLFSLPTDPRVTVQLKSKEQRALTFYPSHTATPATIIVSGSRASCSVVLSLRGRTRRECS